jgi:predicted SnoaL-like aldol condensation-catalyzing enzyme
MPADDTTQEALFSVFIDDFYNTKEVQTAFTTFVDENYIQHSPSALSGRKAALDFLTPVLSSVNFTMMHQGFYSGTGYVHY